MMHDDRHNNINEFADYVIHDAVETDVVETHNNHTIMIWAYIT